MNARRYVSAPAIPEMTPDRAAAALNAELADLADGYPVHWSEGDRKRRAAEIRVALMKMSSRAKGETA